MPSLWGQRELARSGVEIVHPSKLGSRGADRYVLPHQVGIQSAAEEHFPCLLSAESNPERRCNGRSDWTRSPRPLTNPSTPPVRWDVPSPSLARALHQVISRNRVSAAEPTKRRHCSLPIVVAFGKPPVHAGPPGGGRWRSWNTLSASPTPVQGRSRHCGQGTWWSSLQVHESARCSRTNASTSSLLPLTANLPSGRTDARSRMSAYVGAETTT